jgi:CheY-like chemotaxis protein
MDILLIEDDDMVAQSLVRLWSDRGHSVAWVQDLDGALYVLSDGFNVVVSDWDLGVYDKRTGAEIVTHLRSINPDARYAIYSGLERDVPEGVKFFLKSYPDKLLRWIEND